jgi:dTDP-4-dehydrorhamnose 3,5-epimerase
MELFSDTNISGVKVIQTQRFRDSRGEFMETYHRDNYRAAGIDFDFVQDNFAFSVHAGTVRGLHFQAPPHTQAKLVRCTKGRIFDVAVDLRRGCPTYGQWFGIELDADGDQQLLVPEGFAHGYMTLLPDTEVVYKCSDHYAPQTEGSIHWSDPDLAIDWPDVGPPVQSPKDAQAPSFASLVSPFEWRGG